MSGGNIEVSFVPLFVFSYLSHAAGQTGLSSFEVLIVVKIVPELSFIPLKNVEQKVFL